jgi:hypothetical protein
MLIQQQQQPGEEIARDGFGNPRYAELVGLTDPEVVDFCDDVWYDTYNEDLPICNRSFQDVKSNYLAAFAYL